MQASPDFTSVDKAERSPREMQRRVLLFEERYGEGAHARLLALLERPCLSFADIAVRFRVTRERVRQWHREWLPSAPSGLERRALCRAFRARRELLDDPLVSSFFALVRERGTRVGLIRSRTGYRRRLVRVNGRVVALRQARSSAGRGPGSPDVRVERYQGRAELLYVSFGAAGYLLVPVALIPAHGLVVRDWGRSRVTPYVNSLHALDAATPV